MIWCSTINNKVIPTLSKIKGRVASYVTASIVPKPIVSRLSNGLQVVSLDAPGHFLSIGVYVQAGSRYEDDSLTGASHFIDRMAFKSTADYDTQTLVSKLESLGGNVASQSSRENMIYQASVFRHDLDKIVTFLASIVQRPLLRPEEVDETRITTGYELDDMRFRPDMVLPEQLHEIAFGGADGMPNTLGRPMICPKERLELLTSETLHRYRSIWFTPNRMTIAAVGVTHEELYKLAETHFGTLSAPEPQTVQYQSKLSLPAQYTGGIRCFDTTHLPPSPNPDDIPLTYVYIGFESIAANDPDVYAAATLGSLLGGGGSFSAGGPGKGMYTRMYRQVLNRYHWIESCSHLNFNYLDSGLFGLYAAIPPHPSTHKAIVPVLCDQLISAIQHIEPEELSRAKNQLKSNLMMGIESKLVQIEDLGRQYLTYKKHVDLIETCRRIDLVEADDIKRIARRIILGEDLSSRFEFNDSVCQHWKRTGNGQVTVIVHGPLSKNDPLNDIENVLKEWHMGRAESFNNEMKRKKSFFKKLKIGGSS